MPLLPGKKNIGRNIEEMERAGHPYRQALAASLRKAGVKRKGHKRKSWRKTKGSSRNQRHRHSTKRQR